MADEDTIYDLGEIDRGQRRVFGKAEAFDAPSRSRRMSSGSRSSSGGVGGGLAGSLSMFVPGLGQLIAGEIAWGLFYLTGIGFCGAVLWALMETMERIVPVLGLLDVSLSVLVVAVLSLAGLTMLFHVAAVLHAHAIAAHYDDSAPHPIVAAIASLAIPGWGQLLAGHRRRAAVFHFGIWLLGTAWLMVTPQGTRLLERLGLNLPAALRDGWGPAALMATPVILWIIAVYDAAAGAAAERRR
jgi:TM2 domain-containing membrane protein YozV